MTFSGMHLSCEAENIKGKAALEEFKIFRDNKVNCCRGLPSHINGKMQKFFVLMKNTVTKPFFTIGGSEFSEMESARNSRRKDN